MSKFCKNCGVEMEETAVFCTNCGAMEERSEIFPEEVKIEKSPATQFADKVTRTVKENSKFFTFCGAVVAIFLVIVILISNLFGGGYKKAVKNYMDVSFKGKADKIEKLAPKEYWDFIKKENKEFTIEELIKATEEKSDATLKALENKYGEKVKVKYKIIDKDKLSKRKLNRIKESIENEFGINKKLVKACCQVDVELSVKGSKDKFEDETEMTLIKIGGSWYVVQYQDYGDRAYISFMTGV